MIVGDFKQLLLDNPGLASDLSKALGLFAQKAVAAERARLHGLLVRIGERTKRVGLAEAGMLGGGPAAGEDLRAIKDMVETETGKFFEEYT